jgi:Mrp family chromosome partitioning ATPase/capsular polysaccharide biosynthesis protein
MTDSMTTRAPARPDDWVARGAPSGAASVLAFLRTLWERRLLMVVVVGVCVGVAVAATSQAEKRFTAHAHLLVTPVAGVEGAAAGLGLLRDSGAPDRDIVTATQLVDNRAVASRAARRLGLGDDLEKLLRDIEARPLAQSNVIDIAATASTAPSAARLADAIASAAMAQRTADLRREIDAAIAGLERQIRRLPTLGASREELRRQVAALDVLRGRPTPELHRQGGPAGIPVQASSPRLRSTVPAAGLAGLVLGVLAAFTLQAADPRLRRERQLRELFRVPLLQRIPGERGRRRPLAPDDLSPGGVQAYRHLRQGIEAAPGAWLRPRSVLVTGTTRGEGATTTAVNLGFAFAAAGSSVIVVDADLLHPSIATTLGLDGSSTSADVVAGSVPLREALQDVPSGAGRLQVLAAAPDASWAAERFWQQTGDLLAEAQALADIVVVDATAASDAAGSLLLAARVDDIVLVTRLHRTNVPRLREFAERLRAGALRPAGIVLVDAGRGPRRIRGA